MNAVINSWGNSLAVRLPSDIINSMKLEKGDVLKIIEKNNEIILKTERKKKLSLKERLKNFNGTYNIKEVEWGEPVGNEVW
jgi:antitoxin MazE